MGTIESRPDIQEVSSQHYLQVQGVGNQQTSDSFSSQTQSYHRSKKHHKLAVDGRDVESRNSRHRREHKPSKRARRKTQEKNLSVGAVSPDVMDLVGSQSENTSRDSRHCRHKSSKGVKRKTREKRFSGRPASPDVIELVRQLENDEALAKQLQVNYAT